MAAACAVVLVAAVGVAVRAPLARVPENTLKFVVGIMLTAFGMFWGAEGAGAHWPGSDAALLVLIPAIARRSRWPGRAACPAGRRGAAARRRRAGATADGGADMGSRLRRSPPSGTTS